ncbi:MAG: DUF4838 domain-containing protein [Clostridia bacterium]|nr:DUF4838 domain-containing protein [Clostridia bacterium]
MSIQKIFALLLTVAMIATSLASCGLFSKTENTTPAETTAAQTTPAETTAPAEITTPAETTLPTETTPEETTTAPEDEVPPEPVIVTPTSISIEAGNSAIENFAVAELKWYLAAKNRPVSDDGYPIVFSIDPVLLAADSYMIEVADDCLCITGGNERGFAYGFYTFLENYIGVHFYAADTVVVDDKELVFVGGELFTPAMQILRNPWYPIEVLPEKDGGNESGKRMSKTLTLGTITGNGGVAQPCLTDPENLPRAIKYVSDFLAATPGLETLAFAPNDASDYYCQCPNCARIDKEEGSHAGTYIRFINALIEAVAADYPTVQFEINIRTYLQNAPAITKPTKGVSVRISTAGCHANHPITNAACPECVAFTQGLKTWGELCDSVNLEYVLTSTTNYIPTFANLGTLQENMRFFAESGTKSIYCSGNFACPSGEFGELRVYLISKLLLDPMMSEETYYAYMDEFLAAYYGDGWEYIRKYIDKTTELAADGQQTAIGNPFDAITQEEYLANEETFDEWWNKAEELAGDRIEFVKRARYQWRYIKLCLHPNAEDAQALIADVSKADAKVAWREKQWNVDSASDLSLAPTEWKYKS